MNFVIIIPARFSSKRIPGKPLVDINGKPMILHVLEHAIQSKIGPVIVATDNLKIIKVVKSAGGEACLTKLYHKSGTERLAEVIDNYNFSNDTIIVNLQGDEPFIKSIIINKIAKNLIKYNVSSMTTLAVPIINYKEALNSNIVKVVLDCNDHALYFSRSIIPWYNNFNLSSNIINQNLLRHVGLYVYKAGFIRKYIHWKKSNLEKMEQLEQLRILWYGKKIHVDVMKNQIKHFSIDTLEDLKRARKIKNL